MCGRGCGVAWRGVVWCGVVCMDIKCPNGNYVLGILLFIENIREVLNWVKTIELTTDKMKTIKSAYKRPVARIVGNVISLLRRIDSYNQSLFKITMKDVLYANV